MEVDDPINLVEEKVRKNWVQPLHDQCLYYFVEHLSHYADKVNGQWRLKPGLRFAGPFCEELMEYLRQAEPFIPADQLYLFADTSRTKLTRMNLQHSDVNDAAFRELICHEPKELNLIGCKQLTSESLRGLQKHGQNLVSLSYGDSFSLFDALELSDGGDRRDYQFERRRHQEEEEDEERSNWQEFTAKGLVMPNLKQLCLQRIPAPQGARDSYDRKTSVQKVVDWFLVRHPDLTHLDLTGCKLLFRGWEEFEMMKKLTHLCLHDVSHNNMEDSISIIKGMKELRLLDLSTCSRYRYDNPTGLLTKLANELQKLESLDISGTNLCGEKPPMGKSGIAGLRGRTSLKYLGVIDCEGGASSWRGLPADKVAGLDTARQVQVAIEAFCHRPCSILERALERLNSIMNNSPGDITDPEACSQLVLRAMKANLHNFKISNAAVHFVSKAAKFERTGRVNLTPGLKREMMATLVSLVAAQLTNEEPWTTQSACDVFVHSELPSDLSFIPRQVVRRMIPHTGNLRWEYNCHYSLFIIRSMCSVSPMKEWAADEMDIMPGIMAHVRKIPNTDWTYDEIMQKLWNIFWNITDMSPSNCTKFLDLGGIDLFVEIYNFYKNQPQSYSDDRQKKDGNTFSRMAGTMNNCAEVEALHPRLMRSDLLNALFEMLNYPQASFGACGTFAYLLKNGPSAWTVSAPHRDMVEIRMEIMIGKRDVYMRRSVIYRSFSPMIALLDCKESPASQYFAAWEICNTINSDPWHYGLMLKDEGGLEKFQQIVADPSSSRNVSRLARLLIRGYKDAEEEAKYRDSRCTIS